MERVRRFWQGNYLQILCALYAVILVAGVSISIVLSDDSHWMSWSLSRLGESAVNRHSALAFNSSVFMSSMVLIAIGIGMAQSYARLQQSRAAKLSAWMVILLAICMLGVSLCPNDTLHLAHFVFSRSVIAVIILMMLALPSNFNYLTHRQRLLSFGFPFFATILTAQGYILQSFWFVAVEAILALLAISWLSIVCRHLDKRLRS